MRICIFYIALLLIVSVSCGEKQTMQEDVTTEKFDDLSYIKSRGKIDVVISYNSTDYFIYRGKPMGFYYELINEYGKELGVDIVFHLENNVDKAFEILEKKKSDLIAMSLTITKERRKKVAFTNPIMYSKQVLVQAFPKNYRTLSYRAREDSLIRNQYDLAGKKVHIPAGTSFYNRLVSLQDEIGDTIHIITHDTLSNEELVGKVADGTISYTICDENVALVNKTYYPNIDIKTAVSFKQKLAWAVAKRNEHFLRDLNAWLRDYRETKQYKFLYNKYFRSKRSAVIMNSDYNFKNKGQISGYDDLIKKYSKKIPWDWKLMASLIYQESRFDPNVKSWAGAFGLMQLMPETAENFGVDSASAVEDHIRAGALFLSWLDDWLVSEIPDSTERQKFVLASYNVGLGHILDARRLAEKYGKNPNIWKDNVDYYLLHKSNPQFYSDEVVRYGYCRGEEPYKYVNEVLNRYEHYVQVFESD